MKKVALIISFALMSTLLFGFNDIQAAYSFSSQGYDDILSAASSYYQGTGLTRNELAALMLSVTWPETTGGSQTSPSPMTLSRGDNSSGLWSFKNKSSSNTTRRAFWHPGIGVFQLDSAGIGKDLGIHSRINTSEAAPIAAQEISKKYRDSKGSTKAAKRADAWYAWYACRDGSCESIFNSIYDSTKDTISITRDSNVTRTGGMVQKTCSYIWDQRNTFTCYEIDPNKAQGFTGWREWTPLDGSLTGNTSPISLSFISFVRDGREERHWLKENTKYTIDVNANRTLGNNARTSLTWYSVRSICVGGYCGEGPYPENQNNLK